MLACVRLMIRPLCGRGLRASFAQGFAARLKGTNGPIRPFLRCRLSEGRGRASSIEPRFSFRLIPMPGA